VSSLLRALFLPVQQEQASIPAKMQSLEAGTGGQEDQTGRRQPSGPATACGRRRYKVGIFQQ